MKILKQLVLPSAFMLLLIFPAKAQENITDLLNGSLKDAETLSKAYLEPFGKGFGASLNSGWYNTAKPHKLGGFDITFTIATTIPPSSEKTFDVSKLNLDYWQLNSGAVNNSPTVTGSKDSGPVLVPKAAPGSGVELTLPKGAGLKFIPAPIIQVGVGLPFHTELNGRFLPKIDIPDVGQFSLWGVGLKNEFKEFIPGFKKLPFNVSLFLGYTQFKSSFDISAAKPAGSTKDQTLDFDASGFTGKLLISKSIPVLTVYAGVGYNKAKTDVALKGDYTVTGVGNTTDPISFDFTNSGVNANLGLRIKLSVIAFHFDYTVGKYSIYNFGVGINFR